MAASEVDICNAALAHIGVTRQLSSVSDLIAAVTESSDHARLCLLFYEKARDTVLVDFPWPFASKYALLTLVSDGEDEVWEGEWDNAYEYPADCLMLRRFLTTTFTSTAFPYFSTTHDFANPPFAIKLHDDVQVIFTDVQEDLANVEYTAKVTDATLYPVRFASAVSWRLAIDLATSLRADPNLIQMCHRNYALELDQARRTYGNESDPRADDDGEFVSSRNF